MKITKINNYTGGWFIGNFEPTLMKTDEFECAVKHYKAGEIDPPHYHKIATEITFIVSGDVMFDGELYTNNDIVVFEPNEIARFSAVTDAITAVVKIPSVMNDKYVVKE